MSLCVFHYSLIFPTPPQCILPLSTLTKRLNDNIFFHFSINFYYIYLFENLSLFKTQLLLFLKHCLKKKHVSNSHFLFITSKKYCPSSFSFFQLKSLLSILLSIKHSTRTSFHIFKFSFLFFFYLETQPTSLSLLCPSK